ncbi:hypothetical protein [Anaerobiospirillum sp. NML120449]|uniref:hypothetical protein n=1 Tax=Anaerobiospirillum sp. NML120449 TaxID=2932817 RepID=UPI001FF42AE7|nr:hypothetical protein [Anaerobiospirillum sp. NML120449]MCK0527359.1 hypothetical protein [Anaerobiospirillum sp. NML120449]
MANRKAYSMADRMTDRMADRKAYIMADRMSDRMAGLRIAGHSGREADLASNQNRLTWYALWREER